MFDVTNGKTSVSSKQHTTRLVARLVVVLLMMTQQSVGQEQPQRTSKNVHQSRGGEVREVEQAYKELEKALDNSLHQIEFVDELAEWQEVGENESFDFESLDEDAAIEQLIEFVDLEVDDLDGDPSNAAEPEKENALSLKGTVAYSTFQNVICQNSCRWDDDGECDDGGHGAMTRLCAFGTDCADCGVRSPDGTPNPWEIGPAGSNNCSSCARAAEWQRAQNDAVAVIRSYVNNMNTFRNRGIRTGHSLYYTNARAARSAMNAIINYGNYLYQQTRCECQFQRYKQAFSGARSAWDSGWGRYNPVSPSLYRWHH